ncbi:amidohydrolase [Frigoribacterium sp. CFBP9030]|uniref:amidohydrolase n=1 Tax=Frigoribacterium sp. CFBP9030 TaxID=3096537 RepID=UPI002A6A9B09|nr:amidohydrolase [Frigoribacterium sp. CFBP9030]MDY0893212.1 amidohydrolase [Frigoribacterium sp. CFBP9030]
MSEPVHSEMATEEARVGDPAPVASSAAPAPSSRVAVSRRIASGRTDTHQHVWPADFVEALRARTTEPRLVDDWTLLTAGEAPYAVDPAAHDVERRRAREIAEGKDDVLVSLSSPLGIEHLPGAEARELIDVWHRSALGLGDPFRVWAATPVVEHDLVGLSEILRDDRVVGLQLPATCLLDPAAVHRMAPVLDVVAVSGKPVMVHPGPAPAVADTPAWWPAVVPYVSQLQSAWFAWHQGGRVAHPTLRIVFVALAGLAPLHHERLVARGGEFGSVDPNVFYETSSYDTRAIDAVVRVVGVDPVVHGSDRPYAQPRDPGLGHAFTHAHVHANPRALLTGEPR